MDDTPHPTANLTGGQITDPDTPKRVVSLGAPFAGLRIGPPAPPATTVRAELDAMDTARAALEPLDPAARRRAIMWLFDRLGVEPAIES
jgi:hypothetical protein